MTQPTWFPSQPQHLWKHFYDLTQIPRPSKKEEKVVEHIVNLAKSHNLEYKVDSEKNIVIYVPASKGKEDSEPVIIQGHVDMVTDALPDININFDTDPIETEVDGEWLTAKGTTLGADNGIGCAFAMACITDKDLVHPSLELLFTTDEETGLNGAWAVESKNFKGRKLINIDTEEWGSLYVGCAGGIDYDMQGELKVSSPQTSDFFKINITGLSGGHSGLDIHLQLGNAIKILNECLYRFGKENRLELSEFRGGRAHNIIPRDAWAIVGIDKLEDLIDFVDDYTEKLFSYLPTRDHELQISIEKVEKPESCLGTDETQRVLQLSSMFPHGAFQYELPHDKELVSASNNLAKWLVINGRFYAMTSVRFFDREEVRSLEDKLFSLANLYGFDLTHNSEYPSWKPHWNTPLLETMKQSYKKIHGKLPEVKAIHAGLECGILKDRISPDLDAVSFGPDITGAHSPDERVNIPSVEKCWDLFKELLNRL